ncbi:MAG: alpha/beta fold hydrolase [Halothiobacillaceae bacterium]
MKLNYEEYGGGSPVIILHGLFGSLSNWRVVGQALSDRYRVINVDLRNHGRSPHVPGLSYAQMADDVIALMDDLGLGDARLMGHSLGGKLGMFLADRDPERVRKLVVVDIAPRRYPPWHQDVFDALDAVDLENLHSRQEAKRAMAEHVFDAAVREFLAMNLERRDGRWHWRFNLPELKAAYAQSSDMPAMQGFYAGPVMFLRGAQSSYITEEDEPLLRRQFPESCLVTLEGAQHWPHIEAPDAFLEAVRGFFAHGCPGR